MLYKANKGVDAVVNTLVVPGSVDKKGIDEKAKINYYINKL